MRKVYRERHELLSRLLTRDFADVLTPLPATAGLHLSAATAFDAGALVRRARHDGVRLYSLGDFGVGERRHGLVFGYGAVAAERIEPGLARLRALVDEGAA
jgi:GntR family transcriptional regulator/MocR family aminotransferase